MHHLVEKRLASVLDIKKNDMISVALTKKEHAKYTRRWRKAIPYGTDYDSLGMQEVIDTVSNVYCDNEGLRRATLNWMRQLEKSGM